MPDKDREIVVKIRCGEKACGECEWKGAVVSNYWTCELFSQWKKPKKLGRRGPLFQYPPNRLPACLAAEVSTQSGSPAPQGAGKQN